MKKPELLAPAGDLEKLKVAIAYGADAVYLAGKNYGLRAKATNFNEAELLEGLYYAHSHGAKVYVTLNILAHNEDLENLPEYVRWLGAVGVDAVIVSDPGVVSIVKEEAPDLDIHLSTQASVTNYRAAQFWQDQGVSRIVLARELSLKEIKEIKEKVDVQIETFVHGAMCMAYSGRCLISNFLTGRDANRGDCAQPCRWKYYLVEEKRPNEFYPIEEDYRGSYILSSKDLRTIEFLHELVEAGIDSFKIEGRMKSVNYVATVVNTYRQVLDEIFHKGKDYQFDPKWLEELAKSSHRHFTSGFYKEKAGGDAQTYESSHYIRDVDFVALVLEVFEDGRTAIIEQRNNFNLEQSFDILMPGGVIKEGKILKMWDMDGNEIDKAPHPQQRIKAVFDTDIKELAIIRREK
ncbi:putative protease [Anaerobranca californiensis DSM 14826]|jgi:putative protease|uniref:Putative protease n=1 Tax=Anaerobranca californiensis DSM 14826 TaxID=1120989 RepID=A0A1M6LCW2_9FIRM|nr:U32 family peptidase [Anaerobranca californiensis]SHJ69081.1 putative protease [Anaerobranca californiensis DSM 14826]